MVDFKKVYNTLCDVYIGGCYVSEAVKKEQDFYSKNKGCLRIVYGTIEHSFLLDFHIARLASKNPKQAIKVILRIGMFCIKYMDDMPQYMVVDGVCDLAKSIGKGAVVGFINAVLRAFSDEQNVLPTDEMTLLSVMSNRPKWLVNRYIEECGKDKALAILTAKGSTLTHVRPSLSFGMDNMRTWLIDNNIEYAETEFGFSISNVGSLSSIISQGKCTVQSLSSVKIANVFESCKGNLLDVCAAPGGKSVYIAERLDGIVTACDIHPHRVDLIKKYARRMHCTNIETMVLDGTVFDGHLVEKYEYVLLDVPCSNLGTLPSNPDVVLNRSEHDLDEIEETQRKILSICSLYVKHGGKLVYSTCSDLPSEGECVVAEFLVDRPDYKLIRSVSTEINENGSEGYYFAVLERL